MVLPGLNRAIFNRGCYNHRVDIAIVGAGLAGLAAGVELTSAGHDVVVLEASDGPGGRVRTDVVDGHRLDRGFQVLLSGYPEARALLDYEALDLRPFSPGALVRFDDAFHRVGDPFRQPKSVVDTIRAPIGSPIDKAKILAFRRKVGRGTLADLWQRSESTGRQRLSDAGFSDTMIDRFLGPLFAGITLDPDLGGSSRVLEFVFRMLAGGDAVVPAAGMGAISDQLASRLPESALRFDTPVHSVKPGSVRLSDGQIVHADEVIVATGMTEAADLTGIEPRGWRGVTSIWFGADESPIDDPVLILNGSGFGPINSMVAMSQISAGYAPTGAATIVASTPHRPGGPHGEELVTGVVDQLQSWFGSVVTKWETLRVDRIDRAQPTHPVGHDRSGALRTNDGVWICGDHTRDASINGALGSGRAVAKALTGGVAAP